MSKPFFILFIIPLLARLGAAEDSSDKLLECINDLSLSDNGDFELTPDEYVDFVAIRSEDKIVVETYDELPLSLVASFNLGACYCTQYTSDDQCCVGEAANVNFDLSFSPSISENVYTFCSQVDLAISDEVSASPTTSPSTSPTTSPTASPTLSPTVAPVPTSSPTFEGQTCVDFQFGLVNTAGFDADDIFNMVGNTYRTGLEIAIENVTIATLNSTFPREERALSHATFGSSGHNHWNSKSVGGGQHVVPAELLSEENQDRMLTSVNKRQGNLRHLAVVPQKVYGSMEQGRRKLVFYTSELPPEILSIIDNSYCPSETTDAKCAFVSAMACVILEDGDVEATVQAELLTGIQISILDGSFEAAIPEEHRLE